MRRGMFLIDTIAGEVVGRTAPSCSMAYIVVAYIVMAYRLMAYIGMAYMSMAHIVMTIAG